LEEQIWRAIQRSEGIDSLGLNPSQLTWADQKFDLLIEVPEPRSSSWDERPSNLDISSDLERAIHRVASGLGTSMVESGVAFVERNGLDYERHADLFPWLQWQDRNLEFQAVLQGLDLVHAFDIDQALVGQSRNDLHLVFGVVRVVPTRLPRQSSVSRQSITDASQGITIAIFEINAMTFEEGSLFTLSEGVFRYLTLAGTLLTSTALYNIGHSIYFDIKDTKEVVAVVKDAKIGGFHISQDELKHNGERVFNYEERGISAEERRYRIGLMQAALKRALHTQLEVDGKLGPDTMVNMKELGRRNNMPGVITNPFFRVVLLQALQPPSER
jgi:hypothetical protein